MYVQIKTTEYHFYITVLDGGSCEHFVEKIQVSRVQIIAGRYGVCKYSGPVGSMIINK